MGAGEDDLARAFVMAAAARNPAARFPRLLAGLQAQKGGDQTAQGKGVPRRRSQGRGLHGRQEGDQEAAQDDEQQFHRGRSCGVGTRGLRSGAQGLGCGVICHTVSFNRFHRRWQGFFSTCGALTRRGGDPILGRWIAGGGMRGLAGKGAVVTGAASGIGRATALRLAGEGCRVLAADRAGEGLAETAALAAAQGTPIETMLADVAADDAPTAVIGGAVARFGALHLLMNNAGIGGSKRADLTSDEDFDTQIAVNLRGVFRFSRAAVAVMPRDSAIVNVASIFGMVGFPGSAAYAAAKAGVAGLTRQMAADYGPEGIRVNAIAPGLIETGMTKRRIAESNWFRGQMTEMTPLGRNGQPEDIAAAAAFLLSDDAAFITGQVLVVDGGWLTTRYRAQPEG
jgi:NAD(P)-dependent dehydrogenase (short-subunit alcohol dehydrogenase family)